MLVLCLAVVLSTLAFGTVHSWSLMFFHLGAGVVILLWAVDAWRSRTLRVSRNLLQLPLVGLIALGLIQLLPFGDAANSSDAVQSLSLDPYTTRMVVLFALSLLIYFAAALAFTDSPRRLRLVARVIIIFGTLLALGGLVQFFISPAKIYGIREPLFSVPFGPFINRHHFAGYMELALALPLGLILAGAITRDRIPLYAFAVAVMSLALVMTGSRGGIVSFVAEVVFIVVLARAGARREEKEAGKNRTARALLVRAALGVALVLTLLIGILAFGGEESLSRLVGTVNANDPTSGRVQFWQTTLGMIGEHPFLGVGLGAFAVAYTRYDAAGGAWRINQAHNDYLQALSDGGIIGAGLGLFFIVWLFRSGLARIVASSDKFRRGVALGALGGCFAALVHSLFDFTLHTTANALLFLMLAALATLDGRIADPEAIRRNSRRRHSRREKTVTEMNEDGKGTRAIE